MNKILEISPWTGPGPGALSAVAEVECAMCYVFKVKTEHRLLAYID